MGELQATGDIADGKYIFVGRSQPGVHIDTLFRIADSGLLQPQPTNIGAPSGGDKDVGTGKNFVRPAAIDATEEAILNSLLRAETTVGRDNHTRLGIPIDKIKKMLIENK